MSNSLLVYSIFDKISQSIFALNQNLNHQCVLSLAFSTANYLLQRKKVQNYLWMSLAWKVMSAERMDNQSN